MFYITNKMTVQNIDKDNIFAVNVELISTSVIKLKAETVFLQSSEGLLHGLPVTFKATHEVSDEG